MILRSTWVSTKCFTLTTLVNNMCLKQSQNNASTTPRTETSASTRQLSFTKYPKLVLTKSLNNINSDAPFSWLEALNQWLAASGGQKNKELLVIELNLCFCLLRHAKNVAHNVNYSLNYHFVSLSFFLWNCTSKCTKLYLSKSDAWIAFGQVCVISSVHIFWNPEKGLLGWLRLSTEKDIWPL